MTSVIDGTAAGTPVEQAAAAAAHEEARTGSMRAVRRPLQWSGGLVGETEEQAMLRDTVRAVARKYGQRYYVERSKAHSGIDELWTELGRSGFLGLHLPEEHGGGGAGMTDAAIVVEELAANGLPILNTVISTGICGSIIAAHGSPELREAWLPRMVDGATTMAFARTEPGSGSNTHEISTVARRTADGWTINGGKYYISAIDEAEAVLVTARNADAPPEKGRQPLIQLILPLPSDGLTFQTIPTALVTSDHQFTVFLDDVRVGPDAVVGDPTAGLTQLFAGLNPERILAAAISTGIARYAIDKAASYAGDRSVWRAVPIGAHQGISHPLAQCYVDTQLARMAARRAAELFDGGGDAAEAANIAKMVAADASLAALDQAIQTHGGNGLADEYGLADLWFAARLMKTAPVSREMVLNFVAQTSLGLPRSY